MSGWIWWVESQEFGSLDQNSDFNVTGHAELFYSRASGPPGGIVSDGISGVETLAAALEGNPQPTMAAVPQDCVQESINGLAHYAL
jgi:hypothetical protein